MQINRFRSLPSNPWAVQRAMDRWLHDAVSSASSEGMTETAPTFAPPVDIRETAEGLEFFVELPGFEKDQLVAEIGTLFRELVSLDILEVRAKG